MSRREALRNLDTGDIGLMSSDGAFADLVKLATWSEWSHCGVFVRIKGEVYFFHAPTEGIPGMPDVLSGELKSGPQLNRLEDVLDAVGSRTKFAARLLTAPNKSPVRLPPAYSGLMEYMKEANKTQYEQNLGELALSAIDGLPGTENEEDLSSYFCSELVAQTYKTLGILGGSSRLLPSNEFVPGDFASENAHQFELARGYKLGREVWITA
jgi:hypothetical protein